MCKTTEEKSLCGKESPLGPDTVLVVVLETGRGGEVMMGVACMI